MDINYRFPYNERKEGDGMLKWETHQHTCPASNCAHEDCPAVLDRLQQLGYAGAFITDHHTLEGYRRCSEISLSSGGIVVWSGIEITVMDWDSGFGGDVLVLSDCSEDLEAGVTKDYPFGGFEVLGAFPSRCLKIWAHPTVSPISMRSHWPQAERLLSMVDGFESHNAPRGWLESRNPELWDMMRGMPLLRTGGSDAHWFEQIGVSGLEISAIPTSIEELKFMLREGTYGIL